MKMVVRCNVSGKGRGRQVIAVARTADLILVMLDAVKGDVQRSVDCSIIVYLFLLQAVNCERFCFLAPSVCGFFVCV